jgi:hypothetical protein
MSRFLIIGMVLALLLVGRNSLSWAAELPASGQGKSSQNVPHVSGGISEEDRERLQQGAAEYNMKLIFALKEGNYLAEVNITIKDSHDKTILEAVSEGPWFYTKLPAGKYTVLVQAEGQTHHKVAEVPQQGQTQLVFSW